MLKFGTLIDWMNTWGFFFHFLKIFLFAALSLKLRGSLVKSKMAQSCWNLV